MDYNMRYIGGMGFNPAQHPYWQVLHANIAYWREKNHANSFPVPRRGHVIVAEGKGIHAQFWMFGGFGTVPSAGSPVDVWENIGQCTEISVGKRETCDGNKDSGAPDGQYVDMCELGSKCNTKNGNNGGCGSTGKCGQIKKQFITLEYLNDMWTYNTTTHIWTRSWSESTRPTHRAYHTMVIIEEAIIVYGGLGPFCYEYCKDAWIYNISTNQWQSDIYKRGGTGTGTGDQVITDKRENKVLAYTAMKRPVTWSYGQAKDPQWKLHAYNKGYRTEDDEDPKYRIPERRFQHVAVPYIIPGHWYRASWTEYLPNPCRIHDPYHNVTENITYPHRDFICPQKDGSWGRTNGSNLDSRHGNVSAGNIWFHTPSAPCPNACNVTKTEMRWHPRQRNMYMYGGFGGAKKTLDIQIQKKTYFMSDMWVYDIDTRLWTKIEPYCRDRNWNNECGPGKRRGHAVIVHKDVIYLFAGRKDFVPIKLADYVYTPNKLVLNDMWGYNITNNTWYIIKPFNEGNQGRYNRFGYPNKLAFNDAIPVERTGHRMVVWDDIIYLFGGYYDPVEYYDDTWHYNITHRSWLRKEIGGFKPSKRFHYAVAQWNQVIVMFGGYGNKCDWTYTGSPGLYCSPVGQAYYLGDTWTYTSRICPHNCNIGDPLAPNHRKGSCHYGSCICGKDAAGLDCSNYTCPDCTTMYDLSRYDSMACEIWDVNDNPSIHVKQPTRRRGPVDKPAVTEELHPFGVGVPVVTANASIFDGNCYYDFGIQKKVCRDCSIRGKCNPDSGTCSCLPMFSNFDCSYMACPHPTCNGRGICLLNGKCVCNYANFESDCEISFQCPSDCSYQGMCEIGGFCRCYDGFVGTDCSIETVFAAAGRPAVPAVLLAALLACVVARLAH